MKYLRSDIGSAWKWSRVRLVIASLRVINWCVMCDDGDSFRVGIGFDFPCVRFITLRRYICLTEEEDYNSDTLAARTMIDVTIFDSALSFAVIVGIRHQPKEHHIMNDLHLYVIRTRNIRYHWDCVRVGSVEFLSWKYVRI